MALGMKRQHTIAGIAATLIGLGLSGCGGDEREDGGLSPTAAGSATLSTSAGATDSSGDSDGDEEEGGGGNGSNAEGGAMLDVAGADEGGNNNDCEEIADKAEVGPRPQDIIFAIDTSGSMIQEAAFVQAQMNSFSIQIEAANIDSRIILLAEYPPIFGPGVCIDPPLGSGGCPQTDSNPPDFLHVPDSDISSSNALQRIVEFYPNYTPFLRPDAVTHVVIVSDDDSAITAADFTTMFTGLSPHLVNFVVHGIISSEDPDESCAAGTSCCGLAADRGTVYQELITQTDGVEGNLCDQQFQPIFQAVAQQVIGGAGLACTYNIPPPPAGETFDKDQVNVEFEDGDGNELQIGRVDDFAACAGVEHGWYYDDPADPMRILVCPQTCDTVQGFSSASVAIKFGCETIPAG